MALAERQSTNHLADTVLPEAHNYAFFQLVEYIHRMNRQSLEYDQDLHPDDEIVKYTSTGSIGFPASDITDAGTNEYDGKAQHWIETSFFGMHGSSSPLPGHFLDTVAWEYSQKEGIRYQFLDFFNHRLTTLLHRAWRKYRYFIRFTPSGSDRFSEYCFSLLGLCDRKARSESSICWSILLKYSGLIASQNRSAKMISAIIADYFGTANVNIIEWVPRNVQIAPHQLSNLGRVNFNLGSSLVLGDQIPTHMGKFIISISNLKQPEFQKFLPNGTRYRELVELIEFLLPEQLAYDLELGLLPEEIPDFELSSNDENPTYLGWSTMLEGTDEENNKSIKICVRT